MTPKNNILYMLLFCIYSMNAFAFEYCEKFLVENSVVSISKSGEYSVFYEKQKGCLFFWDKSNFFRSFYIKGTKEIKDIPLNMNVSFSDDSKYVLVKYAVSESDSFAKIINLNEMRVVFEEFVGDALWMSYGNGLIIVPTLNEYGYSDIKGLILYSPDEQIKKFVATELNFTANISTGGDLIFASVVDAKADMYLIESVLYNIKTKKIHLYEEKINAGNLKSIEGLSNANSSVRIKN